MSDKHTAVIDFLFDYAAADDTFIIIRYYQPLYKIFKLPYIARPFIQAERLHCIFVKTDIGAVLFIEHIKEVSDKHLYVRYTFPERRNLYRHNVQPVIQVFPEQSFFDLLFQIHIGGCDNSYIHGCAPASAYSGHFPLLQDTQQLRLHAQRKLPYFIQQYGATFSRLKQTHSSFRIRARERAFFISEQFRFYQSFRQGAAVNLDKRRLFPVAVVDQHIGYQLLAAS